MVVVSGRRSRRRRAHDARPRPNQSLLFELLNEMDGLRDDTDVISC
jgi:hypothetical protein